MLARVSATPLVYKTIGLAGIEWDGGISGRHFGMTGREGSEEPVIVAFLSLERAGGSSTNTAALLGGGVLGTVLTTPLSVNILITSCRAGPR